MALIWCIYSWLIFTLSVPPLSPPHTHSVESQVLGWLPHLTFPKSPEKWVSIPTVRPEEAGQRENQGYNSWQHSSRLPDQSRQESLSHKNHRNSHSPDEQKGEQNSHLEKRRRSASTPLFPWERLVLWVRCIEDDISKARLNLCILTKAEKSPNVKRHNSRTGWN